MTFCCDCWRVRSQSNPEVTKREKEMPETAATSLIFPLTQCRRGLNRRIYNMTQPYVSQLTSPPNQRPISILFLYDRSDQTKEGPKLQMGEGLKGYLWATSQQFSYKPSHCNTSNKNPVHSYVIRIVQRQMLRYSSDKTPPTEDILLSHAGGAELKIS